MNDWWIYYGTGEPHNGIARLPPPPNWRQFTGKVPSASQRLWEDDEHTKRRIGERFRGSAYQASFEEIELVNAALYLRRPLLITGKPGSGKSTLAYAVAHELKLGPVLRWSITTRTTLADGLYQYDAIGRLQEGGLKHNIVPEIWRFLTLGPLGTALLPTDRPRVLLIDEIDKSDIDLPNDLLNIFEEGEFDIPELSRLSQDAEAMPILPYGGRDDNERVPIERGRVKCNAFPFVVLTSNGEREFPPPFLRRCLRLTIQPPSKEKLRKIIEAHLDPHTVSLAEPLIDTFIARREKGDLATDQLLNAIYLVSRGIDVHEKEKLLNAVLKYLTGPEAL